MWKIAVGFIVFAALALYMLSRGGDIDLSGEKHGTLRPDTWYQHQAWLDFDKSGVKCV